MWSKTDSAQSLIRVIEALVHEKARLVDIINVLVEDRKTFATTNELTNGYQQIANAIQAINLRLDIMESSQKDKIN